MRYNTCRSTNLMAACNDIKKKPQQCARTSNVQHNKCLQDRHTLIVTIITQQNWVWFDVFAHWGLLSPFTLAQLTVVKLEDDELSRKIQKTNNNNSNVDDYTNKTDCLSTTISWNNIDDARQCEDVDNTTEGTRKPVNTRKIQQDHIIYGGVISY